MTVILLQEVQKEPAFSCICDAEPHLTHYMLDQGGYGYNNFEYGSIAKLKEIATLRYASVAIWLPRDYKHMYEPRKRYI